MRHAFLIIAHNNWGQLKKLIQLLDAENHEIYIHIDKKSKDFMENEFVDITKKSKVFIFQEYEVFWGGFSSVQVELFLFEKAYALQYDYYHLKEIRKKILFYLMRINCKTILKYQEELNIIIFFRIIEEDFHSSGRMTFSLFWKEYHLCSRFCFELIA